MLHNEKKLLQKLSSLEGVIKGKLLTEIEMLTQKALEEARGETSKLSHFLAVNYNKEFFTNTYKEGVSSVDLVIDLLTPGHIQKRFQQVFAEMENVFGQSLISFPGYNDLKRMLHTYHVHNAAETSVTYNMAAELEKFLKGEFKAVIEQHGLVGSHPITAAIAMLRFYQTHVPHNFNQSKDERGLRALNEVSKLTDFMLSMFSNYTQLHGQTSVDKAISLLKDFFITDAEFERELEPEEVEVNRRLMNVLHEYFNNGGKHDVPFDEWLELKGLKFERDRFYAPVVKRFNKYEPESRYANPYIQALLKVWNWMKKQDVIKVPRNLMGLVAEAVITPPTILEQRQLLLQVFSWFLLDSTTVPKDLFVNVDKTLKGIVAEPKQLVEENELEMLSNYLLAHYNTEIGVGVPNGETAVEMAIRLLNELKQERLRCKAADEKQPIGGGTYGCQIAKEPMNTSNEGLRLLEWENNRNDLLKLQHFLIEEFQLVAKPFEGSSSPTPVDIAIHLLESLPGCLKNAAEGEPVFVLRGQDITAASTVRFWIQQNIENIGNEKLHDATGVALSMEQWSPQKRAD